VALFNSFISWLIKKRIHQIDLFIKYPYEVQNEWLKKLIATASNTEWGKKFDYDSINTPEQYKQRVPVVDYEFFKPYIDRLLRGEQNLLWPSDIKWFAKSSGTTSERSKFIPVSEEALEDCHFKGGKDMLSIYCNNNPDTLVFSGRCLGLGGSHQIGEFNNDSFYGDLSAILIQNLPPWVEFKRIPALDIALMDEWEDKIEKMALATIPKNVTNISGVPSWTLLLIKRILEITGKSNLLDVWPNLELFAHGGVNFAPYKEQYKKIIPSSKMHYIETYNASEGFFGIQDRNESEDMLLMLDYGIYYEFMPLDQVESDNPKTITLEQVEQNKVYAMVITTNAGLWRYMIGDTIVFTSINPHRIKIVGRTKNFINAFGEELMIDNAERALAIACEKGHAIINEYTAAPVYFSDKETASHEWLIEFEKEPESLEYFTEILDNALKALNSDYEAKRYHSLALREPIIRSMKKGTFYDWLKSKGRLGGQYKVPRLYNNREYVDQILSFNK
jgi:hypothetical protein